MKTARHWYLRLDLELEATTRNYPISLYLVQTLCKNLQGGLVHYVYIIITSFCIGERSVVHFGHGGHAAMIEIKWFCTL